jgi:hypothetical protein
LGIGRFSADIDGQVRVDGGQWVLEGNASGVTDKQDYPLDLTRSIPATLGTAALGAIKWVAGGKDYDANFIGQQSVKVTGNLP